MDLNGNMLNNLEAHTAISDEQSVVGSNPIIPPLVRSSTGRAIVIQEPRFLIILLVKTIFLTQNFFIYL